MLLLPPWTDGWGLRHHVGSWCWSRGACEATGEGAGSFGARGLALNASRSYEGSDGLRLLPSCLALQRAALARLGELAVPGCEDLLGLPGQDVVRRDIAQSTVEPNAVVVRAPLLRQPDLPGFDVALRASGHQVRVPAQFDTESLRSLVDVLEGLAR